MPSPRATVLCIDGPCPQAAAYARMRMARDACSPGRRNTALQCVAAKAALVLCLFLAAAQVTAASPPMPLSTGSTTDASLSSAQHAPAASATASSGASEDPLFLPAELRARMRDTGLYAPGPERHRLQRLVAFIEDDTGLGVRYREAATASAAEVAARREADCVGFTLLFLAMAREIGLRAQPQRIAHVLSWQGDARTVYRSGHVNARVRIDGRLATVDFAADGLIANDPPRAIDDAQLLAQYHGNLAMQALALGDAAVAASHLRAALRLNPHDASLWSNLGVLHARLRQAQAAESAYLRALALEPAQPAALANLIALREARGEDVSALARRLAASQARDPFHPVLQAARAIALGDDAAAIGHYREAIRRMPRQPRLHAALAALYLRAGERRQALAALGEAARWSEGTDRAWYRAQREALEAER